MLVSDHEAASAAEAGTCEYGYGYRYRKRRLILLAVFYQQRHYAWHS